MEYHITLPSKPRVVSEEGVQGIYEIDSLYPGYGHTLGNSLRRIILSSLSGDAVTTIKIDDVAHEFATVEGMRETVMELILNIRRVHFVLHGDEPQIIKLSAKAGRKITAADFQMPSQVSVANPDAYLCELSGKNGIELELTIERGLGYVARELLTKEKVDIGTIAVDATFTPIRRVNYEVENMRVGDRTDFNRLRILIETNGTVSPREALESSIEIMIHQLKAIVGFQEETAAAASEEAPATGKDSSKMKIDELGLSARTATALAEGGVKTVAGLIRKTASSLKELDGVGDKAIEEIEEALKALNLELKGE